MADENKGPITDMDDDAILPVGWADGDDLFNEESWTGEKSSADEHTADTDDLDESVSLEDPPTTEGDSEAGETAEAEETPTIESKPARLKVKYRFDHQDLEDEIGEDDLPTILQKAKVADRLQAKVEEDRPRQTKLQQVAQLLEYESVEEMIDAVLENAKQSKVEEFTALGTPPEIAEDYVTRKMKVIEAPAEVPAKVGTAPKEDGERNFETELVELLTAHPELRGKQLPDEVVHATVIGKKNLLVAYTEFEAKQKTAEASALRKENQTLKQNAASAAKAPVTGVSKGGRTDVSADDPFLKGFLSDEW